MTRSPSWVDEEPQGLLAAVVESSDDAIVSTDLEGVITTWNPAAERLYGYRAEEAVGTPLSTLVPRARQRQLRRITARVLRGRRVERLEMVPRRKDGRPLHVAVTVSPVRSRAGTIVGISAVARDITTEKEREGRLREALARESDRATELEALMASVPAVVFVAHDPEGRRITGNRAAEELFRVPPGGNLSKRPEPPDPSPGFRVFQDGVELPVERLPAQRAGRGEVVMGEEWEVRYDDGTRVHLLGNAVPLRGGSGGIRGAVAAMVDITDRKAAERQLRHLNETLEHQVAERTAEARRRAHQLQRLTSELTEVEQRERRRIGGLLHDELQQLLVAAKLQLTGEGGPGAGAREEAERLLARAIETARSLSAELAPPVLYELDLGAALEWLARRARERYGLEVEVELDDSTPVESEKLRVLVFHAVRELLLNVVKHAGVSEARVALRRSGSWLRVEVEDAGAGFDPVERGADPGASGLGLFALEERLGLVDGEVRVESARGRGTRVRIAVPLRALDGATARDPGWEAASGPGGADEGEAGAGDDRRPIRVLLVDDHEVVRRGLANLVEREAGLHLVAEAGSGEEALELVERHRPDLVVMDISMPGMGGIEATRRLVDEHPWVRVIGLSMHGEKDVADALLSAGARAFVGKNAPPGQLIGAIRKHAAETARAPGRG